METPDNELSSFENSNTQHPQALGSFCVETRRYLIVSLSDSLPLAPSITSSPPNLLKQASVLCQFQLLTSQGAQDLAIVEASPTPRNMLSQPPIPLTKRELEVVRLVADGQANKQIARLLKISQWTVSTHLRRIFLKLDVDTRAAMVHRCANFL
ncbi:MAG: LuxR C-terminal-related transcriptional regulator [Cyanobacteria bacterium P01_F01_bin.53]